MTPSSASSIRSIRRSDPGTGSRCSGSSWAVASGVAAYQIIAWREIPAAVEARDGGGSATRQLSERFQALIDSVAMQLGLQDSEAYLEQWTRSGAEERPGTAE